jgi:hypothetical protein
MNTELQREVSLRVNRLGDNEYRLAYLRAETKDANTIVELVEEHRKPFAEGRVANMGSMVAANQETWAKIAKESEDAAKRELLQNSAELAELNKLERAAKEAQRHADAKNAELSLLWNDNAIPEKIEAISIRLAQISNELASLDAEKIKADFKSLYRARLNGAVADPFAQMQLAGLLITAPLRKEVLERLATELETELVELKARSRFWQRGLARKSITT